MTAQLSKDEVCRCLTFVPPHIATDLGYQLYLWNCSQLPEANGGATKTLQDRVRRTIDEIDALLDDARSASGNDPGVRAYLVRIHGAANNYAQGLASNKAHLRSARRNANELREHQEQQYRLTLTEAGLVRTAAQIVAAGGFGVALTKALFALPMLAKYQGWWAAFATGFALVLWMMSQLVSRVGRGLREIDLDHRKALARAELQQAQGNLKQFEVASATAREAWIAATGEEPPVSAASAQILHMLYDGIAQAQPECQSSISRLILNTARDIRTALRALRRREAVASQTPEPSSSAA